MKADSQKKIQFYIRVQIVFFDTEGSHTVASRKETILSYFVVPDLNRLSLVHNVWMLASKATILRFLCYTSQHL